MAFFILLCGRFLKFFFCLFRICFLSNVSKWHCSFFCLTAPDKNENFGLVIHDWCNILKVLFRRFCSISKQTFFLEILQEEWQQCWYLWILTLPKLQAFYPRICLLSISVTGMNRLFEIIRDLKFKAARQLRAGEREHVVFLFGIFKQCIGFSFFLKRSLNLLSFGECYLFYKE